MTTVSILEAAKELGIGRSLAYNLARAGELPGVIKLGSRYVISRAALDHVLAGGKMTTAAWALSAELAAELAGIRRDGRAFHVPSRSRPGLEHVVAWTLDGALVCNCEAGTFRNRECWAVREVRRIVMNEATTERALVPVQVMQQTALLADERTYALIDRAASLALSGAVTLPKELNSQAKIGAVMLYGWELGLRPMTALQHLYIINGRVQPSAQVMAGLLAARTDARIKVVKSTDQVCALRLVWPSRRLDETWTVEWPEIVRAKLANQGTWATYPRDKLIWHCTKRLLRVYAPDVINGLTGPIIDGAAADEADTWAVEDDELYNEGDEPGMLEPYDDGRVLDPLTGEIFDFDPDHDEPAPEPGDTQQVVPERPVEPPPDKMPGLVQTYRALLLGEVYATGVTEDAVEAAAQAMFANQSVRTLTPAELQALASKYGVEANLPGQPYLLVRLSPA